MTKRLLAVAVCYFLVLVPSCKTTSDSQLSSRNQKNKSEKKAQLDDEQKKSLNDAQNTISKLLRDQNFIATDAEGRKLESKSFFSDVIDVQKDVYLVDNSSEETRKFMINMKAKPVYKDQNGFSNATEDKKATHFSIESSLWNRTVAGAKGEYLANAKKYARLSYDKDESVRNLKAAVGGLIAGLSDQARATVGDRLNSAANKTIKVVLAAFVASFLIAFVLMAFGKTSHANAAFATAMPMLVGFYGALIVIIAFFVKGVSWVMNYGKPTREAFPDFEVYHQ